MLEVGDYVKVKCYRDDLWHGWTGFMMDTIGKIAEIEEIDTTASNYLYCVDGWWYLAEELEKLRTDIDNKNELLEMLDEITKGFEKYITAGDASCFYEPLNKMNDYIVNRENKKEE